MRPSVPCPRAEPARRRTIGEIYTHKKATDEVSQLRSLSLKFGIPLLPELPTDHMSVEFTRKVPIQYLKKQKMVPLETPEAFLVAVNDPSNFQAVDDLMRLARPRRRRGGAGLRGGDPLGHQLLPTTWAGLRAGVHPRS